MSTKLGTILADFTTALSTDIVVGGTTATLSSATDDDGVALPSGRYFFTLDGSNSSKEHISCDLVGTALTNIKSLSRQGVETTGVVRKHRIGTSVSLTDFGHIKFINDLISGATSLNASAPLGYDAAPSALSGNQLATVTYVLGVVNGGAVTFDQQIISNQTSGEALAINDVVYFKEADAKWYKADADLTATFDQLQIGICKTVAASSGITIQVAISGPVSGFTGLTAGSKYYLSNTEGLITSTAGTYSVFVGWALTTSVLLFNPVLKTLPTQKEKDAMGTINVQPSITNKFLTQNELSTIRYYQAGNPTITIATPAVITVTGHGLSVGNIVQFSTTGALPTGILTSTNYYVISTGLTANDFQISTTLNGTAVNTSGTQSGTHTLNHIWTKPTGLSYIEVFCIGAGGGGGRGNAGSGFSGGGGGGGGYSKTLINASVLGSTELIIPGANGLGATANNTSGDTGSDSKFGSYIKASGGIGGSVSGGAGGSGMGSGSNGGIDSGTLKDGVSSITGGAGGGALYVAGSNAGNGGSGYGFGAAGGGAGGAASTNGGNGGSQLFRSIAIAGGSGGIGGSTGTVGGNANNASTNEIICGAGGGGGGGTNSGGQGANGGNGGKYGGGGGGGGYGTTTGNGGNGANGLVVVIEHYV